MIIYQLHPKQSASLVIALKEYGISFVCKIASATKFRGSKEDAF